MTQEEKAKAYDEAIRKAAALYKVSEPMSACNVIIETIFPELKESEDEEIRKWIIDDIRYNMNNEPLNNSEYKKKAEKAIAWLEKQGEQKSYSWKPTKEQFEALNYAYNSCSDTERGNYYEGILETLIEDLHRLEKQGEQKPTIEMKSAEESLGIDSDTYNKIVDECIYGEQKPTKGAKGNDREIPFSEQEWSEEDEKKLNRIYTDGNNSFVFTQKRSDNEGIEYVRKDAFIEKLECWLNEKGREYYGEFGEGFLIEFNTSEEAIADFKKYMKGE